MTTTTPDRQHLIDYTVRNITTGDEEDIRILELSDHEILNGFPPEVAHQIYALIKEVGYSEGSEYADWTAWQTNQEKIRELLLPLISHRDIYELEYSLWEEAVVEDDWDLVKPASLEDKLWALTSLEDQIATMQDEALENNNPEIGQAKRAQLWIIRCIKEQHPEWSSLANTTEGTQP